MMRSFGVVVLLAGTLSCATSSIGGGAATGVAGRRYKVTVVGASIADTDPAGAPWHRTKPDEVMSLIGRVAELSCTPVVGAVVSAITKSYTEESPIPPAALATVLIGASRFQTYTFPPSLDPQWQYAFAYDRGSQPDDTAVVIEIRDFDRENHGAGALMGRYEMTLQQLLGKPEHLLRENGSVRNLQLRISPISNVPESSSHDFVVNSDKSLAELAELEVPAEGVSEPMAWRKVFAMNGDVIHITATGRVCPNGHDLVLKDQCYGPEGGQVLSARTSHALPGFYEAPEAALIGVFAGRPIVVKGETRFTAKQSGYLILAVNDSTPENNSGGFTVHVELNPK
jgi:hypothetical protein